VRARLARHAAVQRKRAGLFLRQTAGSKLGLTPKEAEVLLWVAQGKSNAEAAVILGVGEATVKKHLEHIFEKLGVEKRGAASLLAMEALGA
jgi:DNA-binding CsgD family transcriptional regulator